MLCFEQELSPCVARLRYMVSFYAIVDFLAVFPYYFAETFAWVDQYDDYLRLLRLLRILKVPLLYLGSILC